MLVRKPVSPSGIHSSLATCSFPMAGAASILVLRMQMRMQMVAAVHPEFRIRRFRCILISPAATVVHVQLVTSVQGSGGLISS
jgi:hypothetical protein